MALEIEVKLQVADHGMVRQRLCAEGAEPRGTVRETNIFFDDPKASLRGRDVGLRVRFSKREGAAIPAALLTVKGPAETQGLRSRESFDVKLLPHDQIVPLLEMLGFRQVLLFEKDRETWALDRCLVELDTLPEFGNFVEIEGPSEAVVLEVQKKLGLEGIAPHRASYSRMAGEFVEREKLAGRALRFG